MPKKADAAETPETPEAPLEQVVSQPVLEESVPVVRKPFTYPTIGQGVTIWATDQEDADAQAAVHPLRKVS